MQENITPLDKILGRINAIKDLSTIAITVKNWYSIILFRLGIFSKITVRFRSGRSYRISNQKDYFNFVHKNKEWAIELIKQLNLPIKIKHNLIEIKSGRDKVKLYYDSKTTLGNTVDLAIEQFVKEQYKDLNVRNRQVVDIGASVGDTAIYFALNGAKSVYAYEPYPYTYKIALKNVSLNKLKRKIAVINKGVGGKQTYIRINPNYESQSGSDLHEGIQKTGKKIEIVDLGSVVNQYKVKNGVLKIDCEGCEYGIIAKTSDENLLKFNEIFIEYHYGYIDLENRLKSLGFRVHHSIPKYMGYSGVRNPNMYIGLIMASKD